MPKVVTTEQKQEIDRLKEEGYRISEIADKLELHSDTVSRYFNEAEGAEESKDVSKGDAERGTNLIEKDITYCIKTLKAQAEGRIREWIQERLEEENIWIGTYQEVAISDVYDLFNRFVENKLCAEDIKYIDALISFAKKKKWSKDKLLQAMSLVVEKYDKLDTAQNRIGQLNKVWSEWKSKSKILNEDESIP